MGSSKALTRAFYRNRPRDILTSCAATTSSASLASRASLLPTRAHVYSDRRCVVSNCCGLRAAVERERTARDIGRPSWSHEDEKGRRAGPPWKEGGEEPDDVVRKPWRLHIGRIWQGYVCIGEC